MVYEVWDVPTREFVSSHPTNAEAWQHARVLDGHKTVIGVRVGLERKYTRWLVEKMGDPEWVAELRSRSDEADRLMSKKTLPASQLVEEETL